MTPEGKVKKYLKIQCEARGWVVKVLAGDRGWPDRGIFGRYQGRVAWIEVKASSTRHPKKHIEEQKAVIAWINSRGGFARMVTDNAGIDALMSELEKWLK